MLLLLSVIAITVLSTVVSDDINTIVETSCGPVRGKLSETLFDQRPYYAFKGIPYAEPPVNKLRFKVRGPYERCSIVRPKILCKTFMDICISFYFKI